MKTPKHNQGGMLPSFNGMRRLGAIACAIIAAMLTFSVKASPHHDIAAANFDVSHSTSAPTVTTTLSINDMQARTGAAKGTYPVQIGPDVTDDATTGVLIGAVSENGRDNGETSVNRKGTNYCFAHAGLASVLDSTTGYNIYSDADASTTTNVAGKFNINVAGAWFPFSTWVGGRIYNATNANPSFGNGITNDTITGTAGLVYGRDIYEPSAGNYVVDLTGFGIDSRTDGILLVNSGKAEINWANSGANPDDGTWNVRVKNSDDNGGGAESDYFSFVFIPRTNTSVVSGQFLGDGSINLFSGLTPQFTVSSNGVGTYELKIPGYNPTNGVLIVSPDQSGTVNQDNMVTYQPNAANNGWIIQTRDYPGINSPLEALPSDEVVCSFVFIPADNDLPNLVLSPATLSVVEGQTNTYTVALNSQPTEDVTVNIVSGDTAQGTVSPTTLTFNSSDWNVPKTVSVIGTEDLTSEGSVRYGITNSVSSTDPIYSTVVPAVVLATTLDNEAVLSLPSGGAVYTVGSAGVGVDGRAAIDDANTTNYNGSTMTVTLTANGSSDDRLEIRNTGTGPGQISVSGNTVSYEGVAIATFTGGVGTTPLSVSFNNASNPTNAQALLQSVIFRNVNSDPDITPRTVSVSVTHPDGGVGSATTTVQLGSIHIVNFQQNVDSGYGVYTNEADIEIHTTDPETPFPAGRSALAGLFIDYPQPGGNASQVLLRFDNLFGDGPGQIPLDAQIVSADLYLHVIDNGDGSPLYRMMVPFDGENETWNAIGGGVDQDDLESRSTYDSIFGLTVDIAANSPNTSLGTISFSVLPDILAWQSGEPNYGWVLPGSDNEFDGTGISPGEDANSSNRPRLSIRWVPAGTLSTSFQDGVNGYAGTQDTSIRANAPDTDRSTNLSWFVDWAVTGNTPENDEQPLIRFDNIIGTGVGQIPPGSIINAAMLDLDSSKVGAAPGKGGSFHAMLVPWDETNTWNDFNNGVTADDVEAVAAISASAGTPGVGANVQAAHLTYDLTADVQAWASGIRPNYGWVILPWLNGADGWGFSSSKDPVVEHHPRLRVYYTPGPAIIRVNSIERTSSSVTIQFSGEVGTTYSVRRASTVNGTYSVVGSATVQEDGTATFTDNSPPADAAFYRISNP
jgi:hypothetical protein